MVSRFPWAALTHIATSCQQTLTSLVAEADARRRVGQSLASALRVFALQAFSMPAGGTKRSLGSDGPHMHLIDMHDAQR
jgi:predicted DNA-binding ribbon-helix-helix protein